MSTLSSDDHLSPQNPLYYAPRRVRERSQRPSASFAETRSDRLKRLGSIPSVHDEALEDAVAKALSRPLEPEVVREPPGFARERHERSSKLRVIGRFAAAIGVAAVTALCFVVVVPASQDHARQPDGAMSVSGMLEAVKAAFHPPQQRENEAKSAPSEFETILASSRTEQPVVTHDQSETLLQKFLQWQRKP
jgi:hypothetical protein